VFVTKVARSLGDVPFSAVTTYSWLGDPDAAADDALATAANTIAPAAPISSWLRAVFCPAALSTAELFEDQNRDTLHLLTAAAVQGITCPVGIGGGAL
jgi:hypothetical protein